MTAIAGNNYLLTMPYIEQQPYENINLCGNNGYDPITEYAQAQFVKTEFYQTQKQNQFQPHHLQPQQNPQQPQPHPHHHHPHHPHHPPPHSHHPQEHFTYLPMSGSTSPQQSVPTLLYSQNSQQLDHYENNDDNKTVQIKSEYDYRYDIDSTVSSVESSPHIVAANEFEASSQFTTYNYPPPLCDDSSSEPLSSATSPTVPTGGDLTFALSPDSLSQYYSIIQSTPLDQNSGVQPSFTDQMRFIIYEPRQNDNVSLMNAPNNYQMPMWQLPLSTSGIDNRPITTVASSQSSLNLPFDYSQNQVLVNPAQINPLPPVSSSSSQQQQPPQPPQTQQQGQPQSQQQQQQQQLIKCPHEDCPKTFSRLYNLKAHLRSHSPARPYQCPMCPRSFSRKHDLQRHIRVHTGVKPYQCPCCRKAFARTDALRRHFKMEETCRNSPEVQNMKTRRRYSEMH